MNCDDDFPEEPTIISNANIHPPPSSSSPPTKQSTTHHHHHHQRMLSYPHVEKQIDSFLETFKKRSAAAMERAQSLQGGKRGLLEVADGGAPPPGPLKSPKWVMLMGVLRFGRDGPEPSVSQGLGPIPAWYNSSK